jgi:prepilin signal peptidase PulO-like enzyme (type II secretory pathway)
LAMFVADIKYQIIPDTAVFGGIILGVIKILVDYRYTAMVDWSLLTAGILASAFFLGLVLITGGKGMGGGDIKLVFLMGLVLGIPRILYALAFSFLTGAAAGVILILWGKKGLKSKIAFGPFLIAGTVFALIYA